MRHFFTFICFVTFIYSHSCAEPLCTRSQRLKRNAIKDKRRLWPSAVVPYTIDKAYSYRQGEVIESAMKDIQSVSCIRFKRRSRKTAYLKILKGKLCRAKIGYTGRPRKMFLAPHCFRKKTVLHELFHVLGFSHEHTRPDRDYYVRVNENYIKHDKKGNFRKESSSDFTMLGLPYDYNSIMHYHDRAFAIDKSKRTLVSNNNKQNMGKAVEMSKFDILKLNRLYRCPKYRRLPVRRG